MKLRNLSARTVSLYEITLHKFQAYLKRGQSAEAQVLMSAVTLEAAKNFVQMRMGQDVLWAEHPTHPAVARSLSPFTIHQEIRILRSFGGWLKKQGYPNLFHELKLPKLPKRIIEVLSDKEIEQLFAAYNADTHFGARWQAMLSFFLYTGVRVAELTGLRLEHLDLAHMRAKVLGKGDKERYVHFGTVTHRCLSLYMNVHRSKTNKSCVFLSLDGHPLTVSAVESIVKNVRQKSGINRLHCHLFRHTFATHYLLAGGREFELQILLGHESLEMTRRYVHLAQQLSKSGPAQEQRVSLLDEMFGFAPFQRGQGSRQRGANGRYVPRPG